jgi:HSP20 family protein
MTKRNIAEQMFNDVINTIRESQSDLEKTISGYTSGVSSRPLVDIIENANVIMAIMDLPGFKKENIQVDIGEAALEIVAEFQEEQLPLGFSYLKNERKYGVINRKIDLPVIIKIDESTAAFENGVLKVTMPKLEKQDNFTVSVD